MIFYYLDYTYDNLYSFDPATGQSNLVFATASDPFGFAYDGQYFWIGNGSTGNVYGYDMNGNQVGSFSTPENYWNNITWDGEYFITYRYSSNSPTIYRLDHSGNIIDSFTGWNSNNSYGCVWVPEHDGGNLWTTDSYTVYQLNLNNGTAETISEFDHNIYNPYGTIGHDGTDLWITDGGGSYIYQVDDGIEEDNTTYVDEWLSASETYGVIYAGETQYVNITFDATDIDVGDYSAYIVINSNDPDESLYNIPVSLTVNPLYPDIYVDTETLEEELFTGETSTQMFTITNYGQDNLVGEINFSSTILRGAPRLTSNSETQLNRNIESNFFNINRNDAETRKDNGNSSSENYIFPSYNNHRDLNEISYHNTVPDDAMYQDSIGYGVIYDLSGFSEAVLLKYVDFSHYGWEYMDGGDYEIHVVDMETNEVLNVISDSCSGDMNAHLWVENLNLGSVYTTSSSVGVFLKPLTDYTYLGNSGSNNHDWGPVLDGDDIINSDSA